MVGLGAIHELPGNNLFSEGSLTAFSGSPVFFSPGMSKTTCNLQVTSETEEQQNFLTQSFPAASI